MTEDTQQHMEKWTRLLVVITTLLVLMLFVWALVRLGLMIHHTILLFSLGALVAYALQPLAEALRRKPFLTPRRSGKSGTVEQSPMPRSAAIGIVFLGLLLVVGLGIYGLSKPLTHQIALLSDKRQQQVYRDRADAFLNETDRRLGGVGIHWQLDDYLHHPQDVPPAAQDVAKAAEAQVLPILKDVAVSVGESVFVLLIALYLMIFCGDIREKFNAQLPEGLRLHAVVWEEDVNRILGGFVRGQLIIALTMGVAAAVGCLALGIHIWLLIGLFVSIAALIPVFGPYLGAIPAVAAALIGPTHIANPVIAAVLIVVWFIVINETGSKILYPRLVGQAIGLHEVLVLFVIIAGLEIDGVVGVFFAAPVTAIVLITLIHLYRFWQQLPDSLLSARIESSAVSMRTGGETTGVAGKPAGPMAEKAKVPAES